MLWYLPTLFGDIKLQSQDNKTIVTICGLSPQETIAMKVLLKKSISGNLMGSPWCSKTQADALDLTSQKEQTLELTAGIVDVQKVLSKPLKPMGKQVSAVRFVDGRIEEITEANIGLIVEASGVETSRTEKAADKPAADKPVAKTKTPKAAVTVAAPVIGCPDPDFDEADVRATRVLETFLTDDQRADFRQRQQFVVEGADTGHRYLLTSRHAPKVRFKHASFRSVYDLDTESALCVHDWEVPAAEELLGLALHLQMPGLESYVNRLAAEHA
jgi:hypothetical protein